MSPSALKAETSAKQNLSKAPKVSNDKLLLARHTCTVCSKRQTIKKLKFVIFLHETANETKQTAAKLLNI